MFELRPYRKNSVSSYNPFREMENLERSFFGEPFGFFDRMMPGELKTDITDNDSEYVLEADMPGFKKGDINIDIDGDTLTIRAERHSEHEEKDKKNKYLRCERSYGSYTRQFDISGIDAEGIKAKYDDGVLRLTMPKKTEIPPSAKRLEIE